jgi:hypothetical protein
MLDADDGGTGVEGCAVLLEARRIVDRERIDMFAVVVVVFQFW